MVPAAIFTILGYRDHLFRHFVYFTNKSCLHSHCLDICNMIMSKISKFMICLTSHFFPSSTYSTIIHPSGGDLCWIFTEPLSVEVYIHHFILRWIIDSVCSTQKPKNYLISVNIPKNCRKLNCYARFCLVCCLEVNSTCWSLPNQPISAR